MKRIIDSWKTIRHNGGIWKSIKAVYFRDDLKTGTLVGVDEYGNKYYENDKYFVPRNRWVNYADNVRLEYDASQVPAEWHGWLHNRHERPPQQQAHRPRHPWMAGHAQNESGTVEQYVPYSTTPPKIIPWKPPRASDGNPCSRDPAPAGGLTKPGDCCPKPNSSTDNSSAVCGKFKERSSDSGKPTELSDNKIIMFATTLDHGIFPGILGGDCDNTLKIEETSKAETLAEKPKNESKFMRETSQGFSLARLLLQY